MDETYVSTDVEADGPIPGPHSMLSFGSAAFAGDGTLVATFSANLDTLPEASPHPTTAVWWQAHPDAWAACRSDLQDPAEAMRAYVAWVRELPGAPVFVAYPATFDFMFVYWYLMRFVGESPFGHSALDIKTFAMVLMGSAYRESTKRHMPRRWFPKRQHTHVALDDAVEQGLLFCAMLKQRARRDDLHPQARS
jgi:DNA polymerase III alpha subunit (gram-positive type)